MVPNPKKRLWIAVLIVAVAFAAFTARTIVAGTNETASASGCGMNETASGSGCGMMSAAQPGSGGAHGGAHGCVMLSGAVTAVNSRDGSVTVKVKPSPAGDASAKTALGKLKVGDSVSLTLMPAASAAAAYTCPMHPEVKSDKPGTCPKCGMNLEKASETGK